MFKKILFIITILFSVYILFPDELYQPKTLEEANELISELTINLENVLKEYDKLKEDYNSLVNDSEEYKTQIELLIARIEENNKILEKIKKEKQIKEWSEIINIGFIFEADCKSTENQFMFDTWYAGIHLLLYKRVFIQTSVGYTFNFNIKMGIGFYLW